MALCDSGPRTKKANQIFRLTQGKISGSLSSSRLTECLERLSRLQTDVPTQSLSCEEDTRHRSLLSIRGKGNLKFGYLVICEAWTATKRMLQHKTQPR